MFVHSPGQWLLFRRSLHLSLILSILVATFIVTPAIAQQVHIVSRGEQLGLIAQRYGVSLGSLMSANGIVNPNLIRTGQQLVIPGTDGATANVSNAYGSDASASGGYYTVQRGDSLSEIALNNGMSLDELLSLNGLSNPNFAWVGQQLRLSNGVAATASYVETGYAAPAAGSVYVVRRGDTLSQIAADYGTSLSALLAANGLPTANFVWVGQRLRIPSAGSVVQDVGVSPAAAPNYTSNFSGNGGERWIDVDLTAQTLTAYEGDTPVMFTSVSTGLANTPTVVGRYAVYHKIPAQRMTGPGYDLPNVPSVMYFFSGYAIHGAYWHNNFGNPMSHGCVNMRPSEAAILYNWASVGTTVNVHY